MNEGDHKVQNLYSKVYSKYRNGPNNGLTKDFM